MRYGLSSSTSKKKSSGRDELDNNEGSNHRSMNDLEMQAQAQSLLWETRQIRILQAATLDHVLKFTLLINSL